MKYCRKFFATKEEAKAFQREKGFGALYSFAKGSRTKQRYMVEAAIAGLGMQSIMMNPYVVAWNERN